MHVEDWSGNGVVSVVETPTLVGIAVALTTAQILSHESFVRNYSRTIFHIAKVKYDIGMF